MATTEVAVSNPTSSARRENSESSSQAGMSLWAIIREDWVAHGRDWTLPGFRAIAICRFGQWRMRIAPKIVRAPFSMLYRAMYRYVRNNYSIELPYSVVLGRRIVIEHNGAIIIHGTVELAMIVYCGKALRWATAILRIRMQRRRSGTACEWEWALKSSDGFTLAMGHKSAQTRSCSMMCQLGRPPSVCPRGSSTGALFVISRNECSAAEYIVCRSCRHWSQ